MWVNMNNTEEKDVNPKLKDMLVKASEFHGHICPGLAIGVVASKIALESAKRAEDEELVTVVENDACGVDAIQVLTGCTYGKGNLIHRDFGKSVYTFYNRESGKALRLSLKPEIFSSKEEDSKHRKELFEKIRAGTATKDELTEHKMLQKQRINSILVTGENIFTVRETKSAPPEKARIFNDVICEHCGEPMMATRICEKDGKKYCIPCCRELEKLKDKL